MITNGFKKDRQRMLRQIHEMREEIEDLLDSLDLLEARAKDAGKPTYTLAEVKKRLDIK